MKTFSLFVLLSLLLVGCWENDNCAENRQCHMKSWRVYQAASGIAYALREPKVGTDMEYIRHTILKDQPLVEVTPESDRCVLAYFDPAQLNTATMTPPAGVTLAGVALNAAEARLNWRTKPPALADFVARPVLTFGKDKTYHTVTMTLEGSLKYLPGMVEKPGGLALAVQSVKVTVTGCQ